MSTHARLVEQTAHHVRGSTVHADPGCVSQRTSTLTLCGPYLPVDRNGCRETWSPCLRCGAPLVTALAKATVTGSRGWMLSLHPAACDTPSWQLAQRPTLTTLLRTVADAYALRTVTGFDAEEGAFAVAGTLPNDVVATLERLVLTHPLPARALTQQVSDPRGFATTAEIFARIVGGGRPQSGAPVDRAAGDLLASWAEERWAAAEAIASPAAV